MTDADYAKKTARGSLILFIGNLFSTVVGAITVIIVARLLGPAQYGVFTLVFVAPALLQVFVGLGINIAVVRSAAHNISIGRADLASRLTKHGVILILISGAFISLVNYVVAGVFADYLLHRPELVSYVQFASLSILASSMLQAVTNGAVGWNLMGLASASQVAQSVAKLLISPTLIIIGFGVFGAVAGYVSSYFVAGLLGLSVLFLARLHRPVLEVGHFKEDISEMIRFGLPVFAGTMVLGLATNYVSILLAMIASNTTIGFYQAATNFTIPVSLMSTSIVSALFPALTGIHGSGGDMGNVFKQATKYITFLLTPIIVFLIAASVPLVQVFYGKSFGGASHFLDLLALSYLPYSLGYTVLLDLFNAIGRTRQTLWELLAGGVTLAVVAPLFSLVLGWGVDGLIYALFTSSLAVVVAGLFLAKKLVGASVDMGSILALLVVGAMCYLVTIQVSGFLQSQFVSLGVDVVVFFALYLTLVPLVGAIDRSDLDFLDVTLRDLKVIGWLATKILQYERLMSSHAFRRGNKQT